MVRSLASSLALAVAALIGAAVPANAQALGTYSWQLEPFCNNLTLSLTQQGGLYTVSGFDDQCGAPQRAPVVGLATPNPDGSIGFGLHIVTVPGGRGVDVDARISVSSISGPWNDSAGNSGTFAFGARTGGLPRPLPPPAAAKLSWSGLAASVTIPSGVNTLVRTVTLNVTTPGQVMVTASGLFDLAVTGAQVRWCSITRGAAVETEHYLYAQATVGATSLSIPFAGTRVYAVTPGPFTVNLVCTATGAPSYFAPTVQSAELTALFVGS